MEKEKVLEIEIIKVNEKYSAWHITYQNEEVLKRGEFEDAKLKVYSKESLELIGEYLYLRGKAIQYDNIVQVIPNEYVEILKNKVDAINEKYGIPLRWRANKNERYYCIGTYRDVNFDEENGNIIDTKRYELGNYFQTKEEAKKVINSKEWKDFWTKVRAGEIGGEE